MSRDTPSEFLRKNLHASRSFHGNWDGLSSAVNKFLHDICDRGGAEPAQGWSIYDWDMDRSQEETGWIICAAFMHGMIDIDYDIRDRRYYVTPRYPTLARFNTHGFKPIPETGDPAVASPHRPRAVNYGD